MKFLRKKVLKLLIFGAVLTGTIFVAGLTADAAVGDSFESAKDGIVATYRIIREPAGGNPGSVQLGTGLASAFDSQIIPNSIKLDSSVINSKDGKSYIVSAIADDAFHNCDNVSSVSLPETVVSIGEKAFYDCDKLSEISFGEKPSLEVVGKSAFENCKNITEFSLPKTVAEIKEDAFKNCKKLSKVAFDADSNIKEFSKNTFWGCENLKEFENMPKTLEKINDYAFYNCTGLERIFIPKNVTVIEDFAFAGCESLKTIDFSNVINSYTGGDKLTNIDNGAFLDCKKLSKIFLPSSVTSLGNRVFEGCESLESVIIPSAVTNIGASAFKKCSKLTNFTFARNSKLENPLAEDAFESASSSLKIMIPCDFTKDQISYMGKKQRSEIYHDLVTLSGGVCKYCSTEAEPVPSKRMAAAKAALDKVGAGKTATISLNNATFTKAELEELGKLAKKEGKNLLVKRNTILNGKNVGSVIINTATASKLPSKFNLAVSNSASATKAAKAKIAGYKNKNQILSLNHKSSFGTTVEVLVKLDGKNIPAKGLKVYRYDSKTGKLYVVKNYNVDSNGYVKIKTSSGGELILTNGKLTSK